MTNLSDFEAVAIRAVEHNDLQALTGLFENNNRPETIRHFDPFPLDSKTAYRIACTEHRDQYYVAVSKNEIVGLCMLRGWDEGFEIPSFGILVDYRHQRRGMGSRMTEFAIARAKEQKCPSIRLSVYASNIRALRIFKSLGFKEIAKQPFKINSKRDTKIIMIKELKHESTRCLT